MIGSRDRRDLLLKLDEERQRLIELVKNLSEEDLKRPRKPADRSPKSQLAHLVDTERIYVERLARRARDEEQPDLAGVLTPEEPGMFEEADRLSRDELLEQLAQARQDTIRFIAETAEGEFDRIGRNTAFGDLTVLQFLKSLYRHDRMHFDEISGSEPTYIVRTRDGLQL
ncbi:MAG: DinB family protein [Chloroflexi bacterium]|nr:DinB family protein [Chloroflexota bacterium]